MEVKIEESEQSKFQAKQNQTGIPFPYGASRPVGKACLYDIPIVRGISLSRSRLSLSGRGRGVYAHTTDETIKEEEMRNRIFQCQSYDSALSIIGDYVNITSAHQEETIDMEME